MFTMKLTAESIITGNSSHKIRLVVKNNFNMFVVALEGAKPESISELSC